MEENKADEIIHISLFSGIGGFDVASEWVGWKNILSCEINPFGRKILEYYWPWAYHHDDIKTLTHEKIEEELTQRLGTDWRRARIVLSGGFPCQPYSVAGKRLGKEDDRHLWPEMLRVIREIRPQWVVGENVLGLVSWNDGMVFEEVHSDLESEGYQVQAYVLPAAGVGAPHRRDRVWFVAHSNGTGLQEEGTQLKATGTQQHGELGLGVGNNAESKQGEWLQSKLFEISEQEQGEFGGGSSQDAFASDDTGVGSKRVTKKGNDGGRSSEKHEQERGDIRDNTISTERIGITSDTDGNGHEKLPVSPEGQQYDGRGKTWGEPSSSCESWNVTDYQRLGSSGEEHGEKKSKFYTENGEGFGFENFPTVSPVLSGDDGLRSLLDTDAISFAKWRNESIKGAGNAVVPQVVYKIFKAIQEYEDGQNN